MDENSINDVACESIFDDMGQDGVNAKLTGGDFPNSP